MSKPRMRLSMQSPPTVRDSVFSHPLPGFLRPSAAWTGKFFAIVFAICTFGGSIENPTSRALAAPPETIAVDKIPIAWNPDSKLRVYAFLGCDCPVAKLYARRLGELSERFASRGIEWVGVMSNPQDSFEDIEQFVQEMKIQFPILKDTEQTHAQSWKVTRTAEVIVVNPQDQVVYRGRVDDQYAPGITRSKTTREDLANALESALAGKTPEISMTEPVGCKIAYVRKPSPSDQPETASVTYADSVAAIFNKHCTECHRAGEIGPFDINDTAELQGWSEMILETIDTGRMPPWHADPAHGRFKNTRSISRQEIETVRQWVRDGAPLGDLSKLSDAGKLSDADKPAITNLSQGGWRFGRDPDLIVPMSTKGYSIPASGTVDYQYFVVDPKITQDRWVSAAQVIPGDPSVVHHAIVFIRPPDDAEFIGIGWLTAYVPGQMATVFPQGYARKIPAGSKFVFQMHYTPNGQATSDLSKIGLTFVDEPKVSHEVYTVVGIDQDFEIPPGATDHQVTARVARFPKDGELLAVSPHMHVRGKSFELRAARAEGSEILLKVPRYDFNWQHTYEWTERIPLADIDTLEFTASFDNSDANPTNPSPGEYVMWGDQTWEEMAVAFFEVARPRSPSGLPESPNNPARSIAARSNPTGDQKPKAAMSTIEETADSSATEYADDYLAKWDANADGKVGWEEAPKVLRDFGFSRIDRNNDREISREELIQAGRSSAARNGSNRQQGGR